MAYDSVRAQLDKLLGVDRNGPLTDSANNEPPNYRDAKFCKHFLLGFCPNDLYIKQRSEPGSCRLEHSEAAKSTFEKDEAEGRVREEEKFRWMRALLNECRAIVGEEDRKIRGQARRLQESYGCGGELSGLMIRNFDTLKKLGMVSQNAKVRILSEMDDNEHMSDDDFTVAHSSRDPSADASVENHAKPEPNNTSDVSNENQASNAKGEQPKETDDSQSDAERIDEEVDEDDDDDDDDMDGFGLIKVIPAGDNQNPVMDEKDKEAGPAVSDVNVNSETSASRGDPSITEKVSIRQQNEVHRAEERGKGDSCAFDNNSDIKQLPSPREKEATLKSESGKGSEIGVKESTVEKSTTVGVDHSSAVVSEEEKRGNVELSLSKLPGGEKADGNNIMDKFYESGIGPDGLLMLDRKQSKRVLCMLRWSHHSLAQLRAKIPEMDAALAKGPRYSNETRNSRHGNYEDRDYGRSRNNDDIVIHTLVGLSIIPTGGRAVRSGIQVLVTAMTTGTVRVINMMIMTTTDLMGDMTGTTGEESDIVRHPHIAVLDVDEVITKWPVFWPLRRIAFFARKCLEVPPSLHVGASDHDGIPTVTIR
ncbi:luc7-like protein [Gracilaria domingensis]|nr:luc7-like protein [Gracilaria domingensis]